LTTATLCYSWTHSDYNVCSSTALHNAAAELVHSTSVDNLTSLQPYDNSTDYQLHCELKLLYDHTQHISSQFCSAPQPLRHLLSDVISGHINSQIRRCLSDKNPVQRTCFLSLWSTRLQQLSDSSFGKTLVLPSNQLLKDIF